MITAVELLQQNGIKLPNAAPGRHYTTCPQCSTGRSLARQRLEVLGVTIDGDKVSWGCNHCGWTGPEKGSGVPRGNGGDLTAYVYRDGGGVARFRKVRNLPGRQPRFWLQQPDGGGGWKKGTKGVDTSIIYRADEVRRAVADGREIAIVEGEKDSDRLWSIGIPATCNAHGASELGKKPKWTKAHCAQLKGADLVVFNDNDPAGYEHADAACRLSIGVAKRVRRLDLAPHWPGIPKGGDVSDYLAAGHTAEQLLDLIEGAPDYVPADGSPATGEASASETPADDDAELTRLAKLTMFDYERTRAEAAKRLGVRAAMLDKLVAAKRTELGLDGGDGLQGSAVTFEEIEPWPEPVTGDQLLNDIASVIRSHVIMPDHCRDIDALWVVHTYVIRRFKISPKLSIRSPARRCGKTTLLEVLAELVFRAWTTGSITKAALFRVIDKWHPTLLIDEVDTFVGEDEELRGILNHSHRYDGYVTRTVGDDHEPRKFSVYAAVALSGIGGLAETLADRSVTVDLKRRNPSEAIARLRIGRVEHLHELRRRIVRWVADHEDRIAGRDPEMPGIIDREADNWQVLLAIADEAEGEWPTRARKAAEQAHVVGAGDNASRLELLLGDIRGCFVTKRRSATVAALFAAKLDVEISSADLVETLVALEGRPWAEMGKSGKPLTQNRLARLVKPLGIAPRNVGPEEARVRGYKLADFKEAFERYLAPEAQEGGLQPPIRPERDEIRTSDISKPHSPDPGCAVVKREKPNNDGLLGTCAVAKVVSDGNARVRSDEMPYDGPVVEVPDPEPDPLDERGQPLTVAPCTHCGRPGGNRVGLGDGTEVHLHPGCEVPFKEKSQ